MKKLNRLFAALLLCAVPAAMISCSDEDEYTDEESQEEENDDVDSQQ